MKRSPTISARALSSELENLRDESQLRALEILRGVNLCSNDYLGLADDPRLKQAVVDAVSASERVGSTGSRLLSGQFTANGKNVESEFAEFAGTESALYFGSGYAANVGLLSSVLRPGDIVFSDALNHASLIDGIRLSGARKVIYPHCDLQFLERACAKIRSAAGARVIVTESVFSMEGDVAPLADLLRLANAYGAELIVDEAHATGVSVRKAVASRRTCDCEREILAIVHTCGKALASIGAFVCGNRSAQGISGQSRAHFHFQHCHAAVPGAPDQRRPIFGNPSKTAAARISANSPLNCAAGSPPLASPAARAARTSSPSSSVPMKLRSTSPRNCSRVVLP